MIPPQPDETRVAFIVNILRLQGIEVGRATSEVKLKEGTFPAGSFVIKRDQPYGRLAKILLEKQNFPDPSLTTYDDTAWTMGMMAHAKVVESADENVLACADDADREIRPERYGFGRRIGLLLRGGRQRIEQYDHAALPPEGRRGASE